jgi:TatA/E family protein of Tat protein translocase
MIPLSDLIILALVALLVFGPRRLPEIGRIIGKGLAEFRKASTELRRSINAELALDEDRQRTAEPPLRSTRWPAPVATGEEASTVAPASPLSSPPANDPAIADVTERSTHG